MTRPAERIDEILSELAEAWRLRPDYRLCQLLVNLVNPSDPTPEVFNFEDGELLERLKALPRVRDDS